MSVEKTFKKLSYKEYKEKFWDVAKRNNLTDKDHNGNNTVSMPTSANVHTYILYEQLNSIGNLLIDKKLMPDPRFEQVAEEIDNLKKEVSRLESKVDDLEEEKCLVTKKSNKKKSECKNINFQLKL